MRLDVEDTSYRLLRLNPCVAVHELRLRMRGTRAFWVLFAYTGIAAGIFLLALWMTAYEASRVNGPGWHQPNLGRTVLTTLAYTQLVLIFLILPAYSAGAITMEREKRTLDMLRATLLTPADVISGKLLVVLAMGFLLLLTSLPIAAWCLLLGGVAPEEVLAIYSYLAVVGAFSAGLGLLFSALLGRSVGAVVASYGTLLALLILPLIVMSIISIANMGSGGPANTKLGDLWGALLLTVVALICAWLVFLALRWGWRRISRRRRIVSDSLGPALAAAALLVFLLTPGSPALTSAAGIPVGWLFVPEPFISLGGIIDGGVVSSVVGLRSVGSIDLQTLTWLVCTVVGLFAAVLCWVLSIRIFRVRR